MADLSAYLDFSVVLDYSSGTPQFRLTDTSPYPAGVSATVSGSVSIYQPDGLTTQGAFGDVSYDGTALTTAIKELRKDYRGQPQNGVYKVTYTVRATGYDDTQLIKTFSLNYKEPTLNISKALNVFTPVLSLIDSSTYVQSGFLLQSVARTWQATPVGLSTIGGLGQVFNLSVGGVYYDASYVAILDSIVEYDILGSTWVTILDKVSKSITFTANTPPSLSELRQDLVDLKASIQSCDGDMEDYFLASSIFNQLVDRGRAGDYDGLEEYVNTLLRIFNNNVTPTYVNTNNPIPAYDWGSANPGSVQWSDILNKPESFEITFKVGDPGYPANGDSILTDSRFANRKLLVSRGYLQQWPSNPGDGNSYYEKILSSDTITFYGALQTGEPIHIIGL